jgi:short-subunit dehydrogenase
MVEKIVVTGATSGLGRALVFALAEAGYQPVPTGRNAEKVAVLAHELGVVGYTLDVSDPDEISAVCAQMSDDLGPIDGLINNAGIWLEGEFETYSATQIQAVMNTNTNGTILMTHALLPAMLARGQGTIINTISTGALYTRKMISVYSASKWAIRGFTGCLEVECAPKGVRVMGFYPGKIDSNMYESAGISRDLEVAMSPEQGATMVLTMLQDKAMVWSHVSGRSLNDYA